MDAETLATTLTSGSHSESEKLRLIRTTISNGHLSAADVTYVQQRLGVDRRLAKLAVEFADVSRNKEFAIAELFSANTITPGLVATRFRWLYTTDVLLNEDFLVNELSKLSHSTKLKVLYAIGSNVDDVELGDQLWKVVRTSYSLRYSNRLLAACSNELIIREVTASKIVQLTDAQMLRILQKRLDSGVELLHKLRLLSKDLKQNMDFANAIHYLLLHNFEKGFNILVETEMTFELGANRTRSLLKALAVCGDSVATERIVKYVDYLHKNSLRRYASKDLYEQCFLERNKEFDPDDDVDSRLVMSWLKGFPQAEKRRFLESLYLKKYKKSIMEVPMKVFPEMLYVLNENEWTSIVNERLEKKHYYLARLRANEHGHTFWRAMLPCKESFLDLKDLLATEASADGRTILYCLMITSPIIQHDAKALEEQLKFVVRRCRNESSVVQESIVSAINRYYETEDRVRANIWPYIKEIFEILLLEGNRQYWSKFDVLFGVLKSIDPKDTETVKDVAGILSKAHLNHESSWPYDFSSYFKKIPHHDHEFIIKQMLDDQDVYLEKKRKSNYKETSNIWRIFETLKGLELKIDFTQYPNHLDFLKYFISPEEKEDYYMNDCSSLNHAYQLIKDHLDKDFPIRNKIRRDATEDFEAQTKRIRKDKDISKLDLKMILDDKHVRDVALVRQLSQLLAASNAITPEILQEALDLSEDDDHRTAAIQFLAMCMPLDDFLTHFRKFIPTESKINAGEIDPDLFNGQKALIAATKAITDSATAIQILAGFMQGDYLKFAVGAFNYYCSRSPPEIMLPFLRSNLTGDRVSVQKHFIRWFFVYAADSNVQLNEIIASAKNGSTKLELLKIVYTKVEDCGEEAWPILKSCLDTIRQKDRQTLEFLFRTESIDDRLSEHLPDFFRALFAYSENLMPKQKDMFDYFYSRAACVLSQLPQDLAQAICVSTLELPLSDNYRGAYARTFIEHFALHNVPTNIKFLICQMESRLNERAHFAENNVRTVAKTLCTEAVAKKRSQQTDASPVLQKLHELLTSRMDKFVLQKVYVELTQIVMELIPPREVDKGTFESFISAYTLRGLEVLCERLDQLGSQMLGSLAHLLVEAIEPFVGGCPPYRARMVEVYKNNLPARYAWFLIDCLPSRQADNYDNDEAVYEAFINTISTGSDLTLKMLLNIKLYNLNNEDN